MFFTVSDFYATKSRASTKLMITSLRIENCDTSYNHIDRLASIVTLVTLESVISHKSSQIRPSDNNLTSLLSSLTELRLIFASNFSENLVIDDLLPSQNPMPSVAVLVLNCVQQFGVQNGCNPGQIMYSVDEMQRRFPHLQSLSIQRVYPTNLFAPLNFPWDKESKPLPLGMEYSDYYDHLSYHVKHRPDNFLHRRILNIKHVAGMDVRTVCYVSGVLNELVLSYNDIESWPEDCFSSLEDLHFLDLSHGYYSELPVNIFTNMTQLQKLYLRRTRLEKLTVGTFDDLVNLDTLSIDHNKITVLEQGIFTNLKRLRILSMHNGSIEHIAHSKKDGTPGSLPIGSRQLLVIDFRWNKLTDFVYDCYKFPSLMICDCDHNLIQLSDITHLLNTFDPIFMGLAKPLAFYGEPADTLHSNNIHEVLESTVSLRDNNITTLGFNLSWHP